MTERDEFERGMTLHARLRFLAEAAAANLEQEAASAEADTAPRWAGRGLAEEYVRELANLNGRFEKKLHEAQHSPRPADDQQKAYREHIIKEHEGTHYEDAAAIEKVSPTYVRQVRKEAGRDQTTGKERRASKRK